MPVRWTAVFLCVTGLAFGVGCSDDEGSEGGSTTGAGAAGAAGGDGGAATGGGGQGGIVSSGGGGSSAGGGGAGAAGGQGGAGGSFGGIFQTLCDADACTLTVEGAGFGASDGLTVYVGIVEQGSVGLVWDDSTVIQAGAFELVGAGVLTKGKLYNLHYFVDKNANAACEATPDDDVWRVSLPAITGDLLAQLPYDTNFSNFGCGGFP
jgi:hypothetical protein